jgi:hypothetical protein
MSNKYSRSYSDYLGANRCCATTRLPTQGPPGPPGTPGPIGPRGFTGPSQWNDSSFNGLEGIGYNGDVMIYGNLLVGSDPSSNLILESPFISNSAGAATGNYLRIKLNGTYYKIQLLADS